MRAANAKAKLCVELTAWLKSMTVGRLYSHCLLVEMCFVAPQSGGKLQTHLSLCAKMQRSVIGFLHDKLTESNVFPRPHPFTPAPPGKITKQGEKEGKEGLERAT